MSQVRGKEHELDPGVLFIFQNTGDNPGMSHAVYSMDPKYPRMVNLGISMLERPLILEY